VRLRLLTFNVHKCVGGLDRRYDPLRVAEVVAAAAPDLAVLQEVTSHAHPFGHRQAELLAAAADLPHVAFVGNVALRGGGEYGNAILSRLPLDRVSNVDLTLRPKKRRSALVARCRVSRRNGPTRSLLIASTHFGLAGLERRFQVWRLLRRAPLQRLHRRTPVVIAGDFNDLWGTLPRLFEPAGFRTLPRTLLTFPAWAPLRALDTVYMRGDVRVLGAHTPRSQQARRASDHLPLIVDLEIG
jgi:endonuclease/exonuclease/phosphatase family metal-dependent hydrolase